MEPKELPPLWALDMAAKAAGRISWAYDVEGRCLSEPCRLSIIAHARTLAKYEKPPVDEAELKRRQDAREAAAWFWSKQDQTGEAGMALIGERDDYAIVESAYIALCHRDGTRPIPGEEWSK